MNFLTTFLRDEQGQDLIEYSLLLGFIGLFSVSLYTTVHGNITAIWTAANTALANAATQGS